MAIPKPIVKRRGAAFWIVVMIALSPIFVVGGMVVGAFFGAVSVLSGIYAALQDD